MRSPQLATRHCSEAVLFPPRRLRLQTAPVLAMPELLQLQKNPSKSPRLLSRTKCLTHRNRRCATTAHRQQLQPLLLPASARQWPMSWQRPKQ